MTHAELAYRTTAAVSNTLDERNKMIMEELPQVHYIASRIHERLPQHVPFEDLVNAGVLGLIEAYRKFDASKSVQFKSFAKFRIRGAILDSLRELDWGSRPLRRRGRQIQESVAKLEARLGRQPTENELATEMEMSLAEFHKLVARLDGLEVVGQQVTTSYDRSEVYDVVESAPAREEDNPFNLCLKAEMKGQLMTALAELPEREQLVLSLYYKEELTMKEIASVLNVAESRVSQLHSVALLKLRTAMTKPAPASKKK